MRVARSDKELIWFFFGMKWWLAVMRWALMRRRGYMLRRGCRWRENEGRGGRGRRDVGI